MRKGFILIIFLIVSLPSFSQEFTNVVFYKKDNKIIVTYDLVNTRPHEVYDVKLNFINDAGKTYIARTVTGDTRKVSRGKNKMIIWNVSKDEKEVSGTLNVVLEIGKSQYVMDKNKPQIFDDKPKNKSQSKREPNQKMKGIFFGGNIGVYFANKNTANYYNGSGVNSVSTILNPRNDYYFKQISPVLNNYKYSYDSTSLPQNMKYDPAFMVGFVAKYYFSNLSAIYFELNNAKLKTADVFMLTIDSVNSFSNPNYVKCNLYGYESRFDMNLCWYQVFGTNKNFNPFAEFGFNFNNTEIKKNEIKIRSLTYSIMNQYQQYYNQKQGGVGYGIILGAGFQMNLNVNFTFDIGFNVGIKKIHVGENPVFKPNSTIYIRLILKSFSLGASPDKSTGEPDANVPVNE